MEKIRLKDRYRPPTLYQDTEVYTIYTDWTGLNRDPEWWNPDQHENLDRRIQNLDLRKTLDLGIIFWIQIRYDTKFGDKIYFQLLLSNELPPINNGLMHRLVNKLIQVTFRFLFQLISMVYSAYIVEQIQTLDHFLSLKHFILILIDTEFC